MRIRCGDGYFFFNDTATTEIYTLSLHDALPISGALSKTSWITKPLLGRMVLAAMALPRLPAPTNAMLYVRSEEHTSELQSRQYLVCRILLEKKKINSFFHSHQTVRAPVDTTMKN